jgi:phenylpropionate dioxygenase-like ring-hydroxylating dioxygenase large terminal subunit
MALLDPKPSSRLDSAEVLKWPESCWWVAAYRSELSSEPLSRWLLGQPVVLFRTEGGVAVALRDRCAHRSAPLSKGRVVGADIACPYHGFRFNSLGVCTHIPAQAHRPSALRVRSYPVVERGSFAWVWLGPPELADESQIPHVPVMADAVFNFRNHAEIGCSYVAVQENLMDLSHAGYLHSSASSDWQEDSCISRWPVEVSTSERGVKRVTSIDGIPVLSYHKKLMGEDLGDKLALSVVAEFMAPGCHVLHEYYSEENAASHTARYGFLAVFCTTPISNNRCHWWWEFNYNYGLHEALALKSNWATILDQDKEILESIQTTIEKDALGGAHRDILVPADRAVGAVRSLLLKISLRTEGPIPQQPTTLPSTGNEGAR